MPVHRPLHVRPVGQERTALQFHCQWNFRRLMIEPSGVVGRVERMVPFPGDDVIALAAGATLHEVLNNLAMCLHGVALILSLPPGSLQGSDPIYIRTSSEELRDEWTGSGSRMIKPTPKGTCLKPVRIQRRRIARLPLRNGQTACGHF